jgi:lysophospholipase L1-like esterase
MTIVPSDFFRGIAFPAEDGVAYPRVAADQRLPMDVADWAKVPIGVRLEMAGSARAVALKFRLGNSDLGLWGEGSGVTFEARRGKSLVDSVRVDPGATEVAVSLRHGGSAEADDPVTLYLPAGYKPVIETIEAIDGSIEVTPVKPRWVAYGDSITAGFGSSAPSRAWPALVATELGLDVINLGFPSCGRGDLIVAEQIARLAPERLSVAFGTNCWSMLPFDAALLREQARLFIMIASGGGATPVAVLSPILRPAAETTPNASGATQQQLRAAIEQAVTDCCGRGISAQLVEGEHIVGAERLPDGIHPDDEGHHLIAAAMAPVLRGTH